MCKIVCALLSSDLLLDMRGSGQLHVTVRTGRHPLVELVICIGTNQPPPPTLSRHCHSTLMMGDRNKISRASNLGSRIATEKFKGKGGVCCACEGTVGHELEPEHPRVLPVAQLQTCEGTKCSLPLRDR